MSKQISVYLEDDQYEYLLNQVKVIQKKNFLKVNVSQIVGAAVRMMMNGETMQEKKK